MSGGYRRKVSKLLIKYLKRLAWPEDLGAPLKLDRLSGLGANQVFAATFRDGKAAIKLSKSPREQVFYQDIAPLLRQQGLETPTLLWSTSYEGTYLIVLEWLEELLPESRWRNDGEVLHYLAKLHSSGLTHPILNAASWTSHMNEQAAKLLSQSEQAFYRLEWARAHSGPMLAGPHIVSGDPNGRNWGIRTRVGAKPNLVLFDWERIGLGSAALDLAGVVFGEPENAVFEAIATGYLRHSHREGHQSPISKANREVYSLVREMKIARIFIAAVLLSRHCEALEKPSPASKVGVLPESVTSYYYSRFSSWLEATVKTYS